MISVQNITKTFKDLKAINNLTLEIGDGEIYGLLGSNGAGKSTTINILLGFLKPESGHASIKGINTTTDSGEARKHTGYIPCLLYTSPSPRDATLSRMPSSA